MLYTVDFLIGFVAFSGDEDDVVPTLSAQGLCDGLRAIGLDSGGEAVEAGKDFGDNRHGILGARVVGGHNRFVGPSIDGCGHLGAFGAVAVAAAAEDADEAAGGDVAEGREDVAQGIVGVGVVDEDARGNLFEAAPTRLCGGDGAEDGIRRYAQRVGGGGGAEEVGEVVFAAEGGVEVEGAVAKAEGGLGAGRRKGGLHLRDGVGIEARVSGRLKAVKELFAVGVVEIDDGGGGETIEEEACFHLKVGVHRLVVVEVVLGKIGKGREGKAGRTDACLVDRVA